MQPTKRATAVHQAQQPDTNIDMSPKPPRRISAPASSSQSWDSGIGSLVLVVCLLLAIFLLFSDSSQVKFVLVGLLHAPRLFHPAPADQALTTTAAMPLQQQPPQVPPPVCETSTQYVPSDLEKLWLDNVATWQNNYCTAVENGKLLDGARSWLQKMHEEADAQGKNSIHSGDNPTLSFPPSVFSRFVSKVTCKTADGTTTNKEVVQFIEPLSHGLRHPYALCETSSELLTEISHLLLADKGDLAGFKAAALDKPCGDEPCQNFFLDIGGTEWCRTNAPGKGWMTNKYQQRGIQFDSLLLWGYAASTATYSSESDGQVPSTFSGKVTTHPGLAITDPAHVNYPLSVLKSVAQPGDFVVVKVAIPGNYKAGLDIVKALMADAETSLLVDELFVVAKHWNETAEQDISLADAYKMLQEMRQKGWRAHGWV